MSDEIEHNNDFVIVKQIKHYNKIAIGITKDHLEGDEKINNEIIQAANDNISFFRSENVRRQEYNFLLSFNVFKIRGIEYIITGDAEGISIYNFQYINKWLVRHDQLLANHGLKIDIHIKNEIINKANKLGIQNIETLARSINDLFHYYMKFHEPEHFDPTYHGAESRKMILGTYHVMWSWFQEIQRQSIESWNSILQIMSDLFISEKPIAFLQIRDFIIGEISFIISNISKKGFQWGYSPFKEDVFKLGSVLKKNYSDKRIKRKSELIAESKVDMTHEEIVTKLLSGSANAGLAFLRDLDKEWYNTPKYTYPYLIYIANIIFEDVKRNELGENLNTQLKESQIKKWINEIETVENDAKRLFENGEIDIEDKIEQRFDINGQLYNRQNKWYHRDLMMVLRVLGDYYKTNKIKPDSRVEDGEKGVMDFTNHLANFYNKHLLVKPYLEKLLKSDNVNEETENTNTEDHTIIDNRIKLIDLYNHFYKDEIFHEYNNLYNSFKEEGYHHIIIDYLNKKYKVYSPGLAYLFSSNDVNGRNLDTKKDIKLNVKPYLDTFIAAYDKGEKHFESNYEVSKDILYGQNNRVLVSDIHVAYYHTTHGDRFTGWNGVLHSNPFIITHKIIDSYGFYSGILSKADEFINKYPTVFKGFHNCIEKDKKSEQGTTNNNKLNQKNAPYLKDLFKNNGVDYERIIKLLIENKYVTKNNNGTLSWNGCLNETSIEPLKLLGTLGVVLKLKNYLKSPINKKEIAEALTNTFIGFKVSEQYYGRIEKSIIDRNANSKDADYYNSLHFIQSL